MSKKRSRFKTLCYGPKSYALYRSGPKCKMPGRKGMSYTGKDWVDEDATSHRGPDAFDLVPLPSRVRSQDDVRLKPYLTKTLEIEDLGQMGLPGMASMSFISGFRKDKLK